MSMTKRSMPCNCFGVGLRLSKVFPYKLTTCVLIPCDSSSPTPIKSCAWPWSPCSGPKMLFRWTPEIPPIASILLLNLSSTAAAWVTNPTLLPAKSSLRSDSKISSPVRTIGNPLRLNLSPNPVPDPNPRRYKPSLDIPHTSNTGLLPVRFGFRGLVFWTESLHRAISVQIALCRSRPRRL